MELVPTEPPGRSTRKARAYVSEIHRLRDAGYTLAAIRRTLEAAGIEVSISTVQREAIRPVAASAASTPGGSANSVRSIGPSLRDASLGTSPNRSAQPMSFARDIRTGKQIAEDFMRGRITNPLLQEGT